MKHPKNFVFAGAGDGQVLEAYNAVVSNDPPGAALVLVPLRHGGAVHTRAASLADVLYDAREAQRWGRKWLGSEDLGPFPDDPATLGLPDQTWPAVNPKADRLGGLVVAYAAGPDVPDDAMQALTYHSLDVTPDWSDVTVQAFAFWRAGPWALT